MESKALSLPHLTRAPKIRLHKPPLLILLHGVGGNEKDFFVLAEAMDERFLVVSVRAPFNYSSGTYAWFQTEVIAGTMLMNPAQAEFSRQALTKFIPEAVNAYQVNPAQVYLMGYSQGAVITLSVMLTNPELLAGAVSVSGRIPPEIRSLSASPERLKGKPVMLLHGRQDEMYPLPFAHAARELLSFVPMVLEYREYDAGHFLSADAVADARVWLTARLDAIRASGVPAAPDYTTSIAHVQLKVTNLDRAIAFYVRFLGLRLTERTGNAYAFLTDSESHHALALQNVGPGAALPAPKAAGLAHVGFRVPDQMTYAQIYKALMDAGVPVTSIDHLINWSMYFNDPDGNELEIFWDTRDLPGRSDLWQGRDSPLEPSRILGVLTTAKTSKSKEKGTK